LDEKSVAYTYREYTEDPLDEKTLRDVLDKLGCGPAAVLRKHDKAFKALGLSGDEPDDVLIGHMLQHPTLLQRPIGVSENRAVVGRPPENLLVFLA
jgi:arsenate reductase